MDFDEDAYKLMLQDAEKDRKMRGLGQERAGRKMLSTAWDSQSKGEGGGGVRDSQNKEKGRGLLE